MPGADGCGAKLEPPAEKERDDVLTVLSTPIALRLPSSIAAFIHAFIAFIAFRAFIILYPSFGSRRPRAG